MPSLKELQAAFCDAVYDNSTPLSSSPEFLKEILGRSKITLEFDKSNSGNDKRATKTIIDCIKNIGIESESRLRIYQNNVLITLDETLKSRYGCIANLVGEEFFKQTARNYIKQNPPTSGNLDDYGESFIDYIAEIPSLKNFPYLKDVAKLQWALHKAYFAADAKLIDRIKLSQVSPEKLEDIKFKLHPSSYLISSNLPINRLWEISQDAYEGEINVDINSGGVDILVVRPEYKINTIILEKGEYAFLKSLQNEQTLATAFEHACLDNENYDVGQALQKFVLNGTFVDFI